MAAEMKFKVTDTVAEIVTRRPGLSRFFEQAGIDYCCGGKKPLEEACRLKGIDPQAFLAKLEGAAAKGGEEPAADIVTMSMSELIDHIVKVHHAYIRAEFPRVSMMAEKVAAVHGGEDSRLQQVKKTFLALAEDLTHHLNKEEEVLFPMVRRLEKGGLQALADGSSCAELLQEMETEHNRVGAALAQLRKLTDGYAPPDWACNTYRALLDGLANIERDIHQHVHKENNVLFPRLLQMEATKQPAGA